MHTLRSKILAVAAALLTTVAVGPAASAAFAIDVKLSVTFVPTSGSCSATQAQSGFEVLCGQPVVFGSGGGGSIFGGMFRGGPGGHGVGGAAAGAPGDGSSGNADGEMGDFVKGDILRTNGLYGYTAAEISSWRLVSLHNGAYVELTIAW